MMPHPSLLSTAFYPMTRRDQNESDRKARPPAAPTRPVQSLLYLSPPQSRPRPQSRQHPHHRPRAVPKRRQKCTPRPSVVKKQLSALLRPPKSSSPCPPWTKRCSPPQFPCSSSPPPQIPPALSPQPVAHFALHEHMCHTLCLEPPCRRRVAAAKAARHPDSRPAHPNSRQYQLARSCRPPKNTAKSHDRRLNHT